MILKEKTYLKIVYTFSNVFLSILYGMSLNAQDPFPSYVPVFVDDVVPRIDISLASSDLGSIFAEGNEEGDIHFPATFYFDNGEIKDTVDNIGFRLRGNTSRYSQKKSFKVSFNTFEKGRKWHGVEKLNLNGEHNDPTVSRSKICWDLLREFGVPAPRANHIQLYINNQYFGIYANVEHIDETFVNKRFGNNDGNLYKCLWPSDLDYLGDDPDLYKLDNGERRNYELITNTEEDDYSDLANLIDVLNNTAIEDLRCALEPLFNINSFLKSMVFDILSGNWDGPLFNKNNFYLYHNTATGLFEYIPYDLDNTFGIDWFNINWAERNIYLWGAEDQPRPLYWRILEVPEYLNQFTYLMDKALKEIYSEEVLFPKIDVLQALLFSYVLQDSFYSLDYGFDMADFINGFTRQLSHGHTKEGIKNFITNRRGASLVQLPFYDLIPFITKLSAKQQGTSPLIVIQASIEEDEGMDKMEVCYQLTPQSDLICSEMFDDGLHQDDQLNDGIYGAIISTASTQFNYYIQATDLQGNTSREPVCGTNQVLLQESTLSLSINEFMASNDSTITDEFDEYDDWVEIHNYGDQPLGLGGLYLTDNPDIPTKWSFPDTTIPADGFLLVWTDNDSIQGPLHTNFRLSADGEFIGLFNSDLQMNALIDGIAFGIQITDQAVGRIPNGIGPFQILTATPGKSNETTTSIFTSSNLPLEYKIFPNPTNKRLILRSAKTLERPIRIKLINLLGQPMMEEIWEGNGEWDISHLPPGIYNLITKDNSHTTLLGKIVKE